MNPRRSHACVFLLAAIAVFVSAPRLAANDRVLNKDLVKLYTPLLTDYALAREKLLNVYRSRNVAPSLIMAYHRRFSALARHETEIEHLLKHKRISATEANQYRLIFYMIRGPLHEAKRMLLRPIWPVDVHPWLVAQKMRLAMLEGDMAAAHVYLREIMLDPKALSHLFPWIFSTPFETQAWGMLYILKENVWPRVLITLPDNMEDRDFFEFLTRMPAKFPFIPVSVAALKSGPRVTVAFDILLSVKWLDAFLYANDNKHQEIIREFEFYYPNHRQYLRVKAMRARLDNNEQLYRRLMASLKESDPHFWSALSNYSEPRDAALRRKRRIEVPVKLLEIYNIYNFLGRDQSR